MLQNVVFPGISSELLTVPLPYQLEALHILDLITKSQKFPVSYHYCQFLGILYCLYRNPLSKPGRKAITQKPLLQFFR